MTIKKYQNSRKEHDVAGVANPDPKPNPSPLRRFFCPLSAPSPMHRVSPSRKQSEIHECWIEDKRKVVKEGERRSRKTGWCADPNSKQTHLCQPNKRTPPMINPNKRPKDKKRRRKEKKYKQPRIGQTRPVDEERPEEPTKKADQSRQQAEQLTYFQISFFESMLYVGRGLSTTS